MWRLVAASVMSITLLFVGLEPSLFGRHVDCVAAVARACLGDRGAEVVADGAFGEVETGGYVGGCVVCHGGGEHLVLAGCEWAFALGDRGRGERRVDRRATGRDGANGFGELARRRVFEHETACALRECTAHVARAAEGGQDERTNLG